jgi:hypothetical protein
MFTHKWSETIWIISVDLDQPGRRAAAATPCRAGHIMPAGYGFGRDRMAEEDRST